MARKAIQTEHVTGPQGEEVAIRFYEHGAIRLEVKGGPWAISQAWLPGGEGANILLVQEQAEEDMVEAEAEATDITETVDTTGT